MKIAVVGSNGRVGKLIVEEAIGRGFEVTGIAREENKSKAPNFIQKDVSSLTKKDLEGFDVVVDAVGAWTLETLVVIPETVTKLVSLLSGTNTRLIVVGGAGSLFLNKEHTETVELMPSFPFVFKGVSAAHGLALMILRMSEGLNWTYISPAGDFQADGEKTGKYILAGEEFTLNSKNESIISYADYALALVDEIEKGKHYKERISLVRE